MNTNAEYMLDCEVDANENAILRDPETGEVWGTVKRDTSEGMVTASGHMWSAYINGNKMAYFKDFLQAIRYIRSAYALMRGMMERGID